MIRILTVTLEDRTRLIGLHNFELSKPVIKKYDRDNRFFLTYTMAKILVVDDMAAIRTSLREILTDENHEVAEARRAPRHRCRIRSRRHEWTMLTSTSKASLSAASSNSPFLNCDQPRS